MARIVLKTARDRDQYVIWGTIADAVVAGPGCRGQAAHYLRTEGGHPAGKAEEILTAVDTNGSSDRVVRFGWWDDEYLTVRHGAPDDGWYRLPRERLPEFADALGRDDDAAARALLERHDEEVV